MTATDSPALLVHGLVQSYRDPGGVRTQVLDLPSLVLPRGGALAVDGESGSGKTTLLHVVSGILPADEGEVRVMGESMVGRTEAARDRIRAAYIGYLFQTFNLLPHLTALENVALGLSFRPRVGELPVPGARRALERVGLGDRLHHTPRQLSVGQQQRVAIARALAGRPGLVLADEPTANLDRARARQCLDLLTEFAEECGAALLVVTHDPDVLDRFEERMTLRVPEVAS
ncbi:MAG: ABC transporter ATP-binding protein [Planctomycetota bacterium]